MKERWMIKELPNEKEQQEGGRRPRADVWEGVARKVNGEESDDV